MKMKTLQSIGILMPGDMGHACGQALKQSGFRVVTFLGGRSDRTQSLSASAGIESLASLDDVIRQSDLILSILPPQHAHGIATEVADVMANIGCFTDYADCNAISPKSAKNISELFSNLPVNFIDGGIVGFNPIKEDGRTRLYVSGENLFLISQIDGRGMVVKPVGHLIGQASTLKMIYASATKGAFSLFAAVAVMSELAGLREELFLELEDSKPDILKTMLRMVPRIPLDSGRWIPEMEEIADTYKQFGMTPKFHEGAKDLMQIALNTPLSAETRETLPQDFDIQEALEMYVSALGDLKS